MARRRGFLLGLLALSFFPRAFGSGPTLTAIERPDLVVDAAKAATPGRFSFIVRNTGGADARSSRLKVTCERVFSSQNLDCQGPSPVFVDIPPIPKGGSFKAPDLLLTTSAASATPPGPPYYRLRIAGEADIDGKVAESDERNNGTVIVLENFQGASMPVSAGSAPPEVAQGPTPVTLPSNQPVLSVGPQMVIEPESPLTMASADWILVRNKGPVDYPGGTAILFSCVLVRKTAAGDFPCVNALPNFPSLYAKLPLLVPMKVPPLKSVSFQPLFEMPAAKQALPNLYRVKIVIRLETGATHQDFTIESN